MKKHLGGALASAVAATLYVVIVELLGLTQYSWIAFITWCVYFFKGASPQASIKSRVLTERFSFHHEGTIRDAEWLYDHYVDHAVYGLLKVEWEDRVK